MRPFKHISLFLPFTIFLFIIFFLWRGLSLHPNHIPSPFINKPAPTFTLPSLFQPKKTITQKIFLNHVTLFNVWSTWCYACAEEHAKLLRLATQQHIIFVGLNYKDDPAAARLWLKEHGNPYQSVAVDQSGDTAIDWGVYGVPETFIIDKKGIVRYKKIGPIDDDNWQYELKSFIQQLYDETS